MPLVLFFLLTLMGLRAPSPLRVEHLTCEDLVDPLGLGEARPRLSWQLVASGRDVMQTAYEIRAAATKEGLKKKGTLLWSSGKVAGDRSVYVPYGGPAPATGERVWWQVRVWDNHGHRSPWSAPAWWEAGVMDTSFWKASWIEAEVEEDLTRSQPAHMFRKDFSLPRRVVRARAYVTAHGLYELCLNGRKAGDDLFTPGWTSYHHRLQYQVYDVTSLLHQGENTVAALVGDGWYRGNFPFKGNRNTYGQHLALLVQLEILLDDGTTRRIVTDGTWRSSNEGPVRASDIYNGETWDGRRDDPSWKRPGYDDSSWHGVRVKHYPYGVLTATEGLPVRRVEEIVPVKIWVSEAGDTLVDMGQNMVGWVRLKARGPAGTTIVLRHGEVLDRDGNLYTLNLRSARQTDTVILAGRDEETFEPHFTFHGFRYVEVHGYPGPLTPDRITGIVIHSAFRPAGHFACSDTLVNRLQHNIVWGMKGNFLDVPTDCPQRDERLGWTGDAQVFAPTACFLGQVAPFYRKWMKDFIVDQQKEGQVPYVIPDVLSKNGKGASAAAGWADAAVIIPWHLYVSYGDRKILEQQYGSMKRWVEYQRRRAGDSYLWNKDFTFGDWLAFNTQRSDYPGATTDKDFICQVYFARSTLLLSRAAAVLGKKEDAAFYRDLYDKVREAFLREFVTPNGRLSPNTQTAYVQALDLGLLPGELRDTAAARLAADVRRFGHLTTGFLGAYLINPVLSDHGYHDLACQLLMRKKYPSWLYPVTKGATTIWERWDGIRPDGSFQDPGMNSFNHYAYGAIGDWLYRYVAGINPDERQPGYKHILLHPRPAKPLSWAEASHETPYGRVALRWEQHDSTMTLTATIPCNTTATLILPGAAGKKVMCDGEPVEKSKGWKYGVTGKEMVLELGSGVYRFEY